jgi:hypothetical protein
VSEHDVERVSPEEDIPDWDFADPLKRRAEGEEEDVPGLDPAITIPPED